MAELKCIWYVSGFRRPWEAAVIGSLAAAFDGARPEGCAFQICAEGGTANFHNEKVLSWDSLTFFEKIKTALFAGNLWHLWGDAPAWWGWVRLRARTVHTSLEGEPVWKGHPTRLFAEQAKNGESPLSPAFEVKADWMREEEETGRAPAALLAAPPDDALSAALLESGVEGCRLESSETESSLKRGRVLFADDSPSAALLAAYMTLRGVPVLAADASPLLRAVLGPGGFIRPRSGGKESWEKALGEAMSEAGRSASASARHFLKANYSAPGAAESLQKLYRAMIR